MRQEEQGQQTPRQRQDEQRQHVGGRVAARDIVQHVRQRIQGQGERQQGENHDQRRPESVCQQPSGK